MTIEKQVLVTLLNSLQSATCEARQVLYSPTFYVFFSKICKL